MATIFELIRKTFFYGSLALALVAVSSPVALLTTFVYYGVK